MKYLKIYVSYFKYIFRHKWFVGIECFKRKLYWQGVIHDVHKFHPTEFFAYAINYKGPYAYNERPAWLKQAYDKAWLHHYSTWFGKHHWLHWVKDNIASDIPQKYVLEMIADFRGTGRSLKGYDESAEWYAANRAKMILHENVRNQLDTEFKYAVTEKAQG